MKERSEGQQYPPERKPYRRIRVLLRIRNQACREDRALIEGPNLQREISDCQRDHETRRGRAVALGPTSAGLQCERARQRRREGVSEQNQVDEAPADRLAREQGVA